MNTKITLLKTMLFVFAITVSITTQAQDPDAILHMDFENTLADKTGNYTVSVYDPNNYGSANVVPYNNANNAEEGSYSLDWGLLDTSYDSSTMTYGNEAEYRLVDNGADSPVDIRTTENSSITGDDARTVTAWIRKPDNQGANGTHAIINIGNGDAANNASTQLGRCTFQLNSGSNPKKLVLGLAGASVEHDYEATGATYLNDDSWHHVAFTYSGGSLSNVILYVDGVAVTTTVVNNTANPNSDVMNTAAERMTIGSRGNSGFALKWWSDGAIDDLRVYDFALTQAQVQNTMNGSNALSLGDIAFAENELKAYPNAVEDFLYLETTSKASLEINVFDISGKALIRTGGTSVNMSDLSSGMYIVKVREDNKVANLKILKK